MLFSLLVAAALIFLTARTEGPWWLQAIGYFFAVMLIISSCAQWRRARNETPLNLDSAEQAVLRKLRDAEGLNNVELIKLVRQRHPSAGLAEAKHAVDRL